MRNVLFYRIGILSISDNPLKVFENITFDSVRSITLRNIPIKEFGHSDAQDAEELTLSGCQL
jgi:hypothetical protein